MTFRVLVIGIGNRGRMWTEASLSRGDVTVIGAADPSPEARAIYAERFPGVPLYESMEAALAAGLPDAVILVTPPDGHLAQIRTLSDLKLPILAEKPLTLDFAEAVEVVKVTEAAGVPLSISLNFRYLPVYRAYRDLIASGAIGEPGFSHFLYVRNRNGWRPGINRYPLFMQHPMMLEQSIHHLDMMRFVYGREVETISCRTWNPSWSMYAHDSNVQCLIGMEGGLEVNYFGTWQSGWDVPDFNWRTDGTKGVIVQRDLYSDLFTAGTKDPAVTPVPIALKKEYIDDSAMLLGEFIEAVAGKRAVPCDGRDHLKTLALCFAGLESAETGKTLVMQEFLARWGI